MDKVLSGLPFARCYIDDVIVFSKTPQKYVGICKPFLNGCGGGDCASTIGNASFSMTN
jgi:hypothetical protein